MKLTLLLTAFHLLCLSCFGQLQSAGLQAIQSCGGATLIASLFWGTGTINPTTIHFEKQVGTAWFTLVSQVSDIQGNYIIVTPSDISSATAYRVRALDMVTLQERISAGVTVNPATWNADRGTAFFTGISYWGTLCDNTQNYLEVTAYYTANGRPPFTIDYKKQTETNYTSAGAATNWIRIYGIVPTVGYNVRITDFCGKVSLVNVVGLQFLTAAGITQNATTCNNGKITVSQNGDGRYSGIAPYTYALGKVVADMGTIYPTLVFGSTTVFDNLTPGDYYAQVKDACGALSALQTVRLGGGFPRISTVTSSIPADSCFRNVTVTTFTGTPPFEYGIRFVTDATFTWQTSNLFANLSRNGIYYFRLKDACGALSDSVGTTFNFGPALTVDSVRKLSADTLCVKDVKVFAKGGYKPYQYGIRPRFAPTPFAYQPSDTLRNVAPGVYEVSIKDRCGREPFSPFVLDVSTAACTLRTTPGDYESAATQGCADYAGNDWFDLKDDNGNLVLSLNPHNNALNDLCWGVRVVDGNGNSLRNASIQSITAWFLDRNFYIELQGAVVLNNPVSVRLYITNTELYYMLGYLSTALGRTVTKEELRILKKRGSAGSPVDLDVTNDGLASAGQFTVVQPAIVPYGPYAWMLQFDIAGFSEFNPYIGPPVALPLRFLLFAAQKRAGAVVLQWTTANEVNTERFEVEWAADGTSFKTLGAVPSHNPANGSFYDFTHHQPAQGYNQYRLKQMDKDGRFAYSKIIRVLYGNDGPTLSPNPANGYVTVQLPATASYKLLRIVDASGKVLRQQNIALPTAVLQVPLHGLSNGFYIVELSGAQTERLPFIKN